MLNIAMVVIVYNKKYSESSTLQSLLTFDQKINQLIIVNNGPNKLEADEISSQLAAKHQVKFFEYLENRPLSKIYNDLIEKNQADYYVLFDDDTIVNKEYEAYLFNENKITHLELPKIFARIEPVQYFPQINSNLLLESGNINNIKTIFSVGSGLILCNQLTKKFIYHYGHVFDNNFAFYGVDSTFFIRLNNLLQQKELFIITSNTLLRHGLSLTEEKLTDFRKKEFIYENTLKVKYYSKNNFMASLKFMRLMYRKLSRFQFRDLTLVITTYIRGRHPRCK